jgi:hypothetical protein
MQPLQRTSKLIRKRVHTPPLWGDLDKAAFPKTEVLGRQHFYNIF